MTWLRNPRLAILALTILTLASHASPSRGGELFVLNLRWFRRGIHYVGRLRQNLRHRGQRRSGRRRKPAFRPRRESVRDERRQYQ